MADQIYYSVFTKKGLELLTEAIQNGTKLGITSMAFGDGGGSLPVPNEAFTQLVNEVHRTQLNSLAPDPNNANWLRAEAIIASAVGGFNIRELGLYAGDVLVAYSNYPATYKPNPSDGTARIMTFRMVLQIDNTSNFDLVIDPDVVLATIQKVEDAKLEIYQNTVNTVQNLSDLLDLEIWDDRVVHVKSHSSNNDSGSGNFIYDSKKITQNDGGIIIYGWVRQSYVGVADPIWFGADKEGATDVTPILNKMISAGYKNIHFKTSGNYLISSELTDIDSDVTINFGKKEDVKILFGANIVWCNPKKKNNITFYNINIVDILKTSTDAYAPLLMHGLSCKNLHIYDVKSEDCAIVLTNAFNGTGQATYSEANVDINSVNFNGCQNVKVYDIVAVDTLKEKRVIVNIGFTLDFVINNIDAKNSMFPAMFWGGDSNTNINGSASNERKVKRGIISKIKGYDCTALAWGSMGEKILITECIGEYFSDVGVDFEGCLNCIATNNFVKNAKNGNFTTFFLNKKVRFSNNISELTGSLRHHYLSYNMSQSDLDIDGVVFSDNLLTSFDTVGLISDYSGTIGNINILNNSLKNVCIDVSTLNANGCAIKNNNLFFSMALAQSPIKASTKNTFARIEGNSITTDVAQVVSPITLYHSDYNYHGQYQIYNNIVKGSFKFAISFLNASVNTGILMDIYLNNNKFSSDRIESQNPDRIFIKQWIENKNGNSNFPSIGDTTQFMWKNIQAQPNEYEVGQSKGWLCTRSGNPATWTSVGNL